MKNRSAFTMIELVFVIVVLGILASLAMGRMDRDLKQEAADTILSHIRLTQQLAMRDNKHRSDNDVKWQKAYWQIDFDCITSGCRYSVGSDVGLDGSISKPESAIDPVNGKYLFNDDSGDNEFSKNVLLQKKFGVNTITASSGCTNSDSVAFDYLGRPHFNVATATNNFSKIMNTDCNLTFTMSTDADNDGIDDTFSIIVKSETGHAYVEGQEAL